LQFIASFLDHSLPSLEHEAHLKQKSGNLLPTKMFYNSRGRRCRCVTFNGLSTCNKNTSNWQQAERQKGRPSSAVLIASPNNSAAVFRAGGNNNISAWGPEGFAALHTQL